MSQFIERVDEINVSEARSNIQKLEEVTADFQQYRQANDLDTYFAKNLSTETRKRVFANIEALM